MSAFLIAIGLFFLGIVLNGLFAGYETGFYSADRVRVRHLAKDEKNLSASRLLESMERPDHMLTVVLIGTNVSLIFGTFALTTQIESELLATLIATPMFLIFAEIVPKSVFRQHPTRLALMFYRLIRVCDLLMFPLVYPTLWAVRLLRRGAGQATERVSPVLSTEEDIRHLIDESAAHGSIEREEQEMIHSIMDLQTTQAKEIMVPRIDILAASIDATRDELMALFQESGRTRIPLFKESIDEIVGVVNAHDVLLDPDPENQDIHRLSRPVMHVPDSKPVGELLQSLKEDREHCAVVTDEYGGTDGFITLEDVLEEIFGEIRDEHDREEALIQQVGPNNFVVDAKTPLEELSEAIGTPIVDPDVETIGGWVMRRAGRIPLQGEKLKAEGFRVTVLEGRLHQISKIRLDVLPEARARGGRRPE